MFKILKEVVREGEVNGRPQIRVEACADTSTDFVTSLGNIDFTMGSIALDLSTGDIYALNSSSEWKNQTE